MSKVKITTVSGTVIEKPVITSFKNNVGSYLVLDNEKNGTMGLPIILVCRLFENKLTKIIDQGEWQTVKEDLKSIISGKEVEYEKVPEELSADDVYYTQLTLPANSFDVLKNGYASFVEQASNPSVAPEPELSPSEPLPTETIIPPIEETPMAPEAPVAPAEPDIPVVPEMPVSQPEATPSVAENPIANDVLPVIDSAPVAPSVEAPVVPEVPAEPVVEPTVSEGLSIPSVEPADIVQPEIAAAPSPEVPEVPGELQGVLEPSNGVDSSDINEIKETFMKACENMFDALIIKIEQK